MHALKSRISPNKAKFISTFIVSTIVLIIVFVLTGIIMDRALKTEKSRYIESCNNVLDGYSAVVHVFLENYHSSLSTIYNESIFEGEDKKSIHDWLIKNKHFFHPDFFETFYLDENQTGYFSDGTIKDLSNILHFEQNIFFVSDIVNFGNEKTPVFIIKKPVFSKSNKFQGFLCAAIKTEHVKKISNELKTTDAYSMCIFDGNDAFLIPPAENGIFGTKNEKNDKYNVLSTPIKNSAWTLKVAFEKSKIEKITQQQFSTRLFVLAISLASLFVLLFLELIISNYFYRNQLIDAVYDPVTKLWTRQRFERKTEAFMKRNQKAKFMLVEADIRGFKFINQNYGEEAADKIIFFYSTVLNKIVKKWHGFLSRGYADHFYAIVKIRHVRTAMGEFRKELKTLSEEIRAYEIPFFPKFGITFLRPDGKERVSIRELIGQASFAKSTIKDNMLQPYAIYNSRLLEKVNEEHFMETNMENALENGEFFVMYQPKIQLSNDTVVGAEALVRWRCAKRGILPPDKFIPLFERNGFIKKLDFYVYEQVFRFLDKEIKAGHSVVPVSVNMSRAHNKVERFMQDFLTLFGKYNIPPSLVQIEILERSVMDDETLCEITERLHREGFTVAMDDFGSGESSLNMLTKIPVDVLKFDREFLRSSTNKNGNVDEKGAKFIQGLIDLSRNLEKETIFEGVETAAQRDFLRSVSCDQVQGYFYSKPLAEADFVRFIEARQRF